MKAKTNKPTSVCYLLSTWVQWKQRQRLINPPARVTYCPLVSNQSRETKTNKPTCTCYLLPTCVQRKPRERQRLPTSVCYRPLVSSQSHWGQLLFLTWSWRSNGWIWRTVHLCRPVPTCNHSSHFQHNRWPFKTRAYSTQQLQTFAAALGQELWKDGQWDWQACWWCWLMQCGHVHIVRPSQQTASLACVTLTYHSFNETPCGWKCH